MAGRAAPFLPQNDAVVLEKGLLNRDPRLRLIRRLAAELRANPENRELAMQAAREELALGVAEADPRYVGYAQGTLSHWWDDRAPVALVVLRAQIDQAKHDFAAARGELHRALAAEPGNAEGLLLLAAVDEVTGDTVEAATACANLARLRPGLLAAACRASVDALTGHAAEAVRALTAAIAEGPPAADETRVWALTILAEAEASLDQPAADSQFREALAIDRGNVYALTAYADYLLDHGRAGDIPRLLKGREAIDALYLRLALAAQATGDPQFAVYRRDLEARFAAARRRGDSVHLRDAARFALLIERDPRQALDLALRNWAGQRAPADARIVLEAAVAAGDPAAARPVTDWVRRSRLEDVGIARLVKRLDPEGGRG